MDRAKAKSMTRTVQVAAVVFVALGATAAFVPLGVGKPQVVEAAPPPQPVAPPKVDQAPKIEVDIALLATALNSVSGPVKNQPTPVEDKTEPEKPELTGVDSWRYLGAIMGGAYKRAIVVIDGQQQMLAVGQQYKNAEIVEIDRLYVKVKEGETEHTINLAARQKPTLTLVDPAGRGAGGAGAAGGGGVNQPNGARTVGGGVMNPSDPNAAKAARLRELDRMKTDAKMRGDEKAAENIDATMNGIESGKNEKGQK